MNTNTFKLKLTILSCLLSCSINIANANVTLISNKSFIKTENVAWPDKDANLAVYSETSIPSYFNKTVTGAASVSDPVNGHAAALSEASAIMKVSIDNQMSPLHVSMQMQAEGTINFGDDYADDIFGLATAWVEIEFTTDKIYDFTLDANITAFEASNAFVFLSNSYGDVLIDDFVSTGDLLLNETLYAVAADTYLLQVALEADPDDFFVDGFVSGDVSFAVTPSAVPVPAAVWLFGSGLLGLGCARKRVKR